MDAKTEQELKQILSELKLMRFPKNKIPRRILEEFPDVFKTEKGVLRYIKRTRTATAG